MLARGLQTKQVAHALGISVKTADRHIQNAYRKIGVSSPRGRDAVCDGARADGMGRTPDGEVRRALLAFQRIVVVGGGQGRPAPASRRR